MEKSRDKRGRLGSRSRSRERRTDRTSARDHDRDRSRDRHVDRHTARDRERDRDRDYTSWRRSIPRSRSRSRSPKRRRKSYSRSRSRSPKRSHRISRSGSRDRERDRDRDYEKRRNRERKRSRSVSGSDSDDSEYDRKRDKEDKKGKKKRTREEKERRREEKREKKERKKQKKASSSHAATAQWGKYGIIQESDIFTKAAEFHTWLIEERKINPETISKDQNKKEFSRFVEDYNTATLPHEKYYNIANYERRMSALRSGDTLPPTDDTYDPNEDLRALQGAHKKKLQSSAAPADGDGGPDSYITRERLMELRKVTRERAEVGRMKILGMDVGTTFGVRMDGNEFDE